MSLLAKVRYPACLLLVLSIIACNDHAQPALVTGGEHQKDQIWGSLLHEAATQDQHALPRILLVHPDGELCIGEAPALTEEELTTIRNCIAGVSGWAEPVEFVNLTNSERMTRINWMLEKSWRHLSYPAIDSLLKNFCREHLRSQAEDLVNAKTPEELSAGYLTISHNIKECLSMPNRLSQPA